MPPESEVASGGPAPTEDEDETFDVTEGALATLADGTVAPSTAAPSTVAPPTSPPSTLRRWWARAEGVPLLRPVAIYLASRIVVAAALGIAVTATTRRAPGGLSNVLDVWDGRWFLRAAAHGWPSSLPMKHGHVAGNTIAFFPTFPLTIRWLAAITGLSQLAAGAVISMVTGLTATIAVWMLFRHFAGERAADRGTLLLAFFPGTLVFSLVYSEGIVVTCVAFGLLALLRRQWWLAGLLGLIATATTPTALAFVVSCAWCAGRAVLRRHDRDWWSLLAPGLASLGFLGYMAWLWWHTGVLMAWRLTEKGGWRSYPSVRYAVHVVVHFVRDPVANTVSADILFVGTVVAVIGAILAIRQRQPMPVLLYGLVAAAIAAISAPVGLRPRFLLLAFPLVVAIGTRLRSWQYATALGLSAALLFGLTILTVTTTAIFP